MTTYSAPVKDQQFILHEVLRLSQSNIPGYGDLDPAFTEAILNESGKLASAIVAPLNAIGDREGFTPGTPARCIHLPGPKTPSKSSKLVAGPGLICRSNMAGNPCQP